MTYPLDLSHLEQGAVPILTVALDLHMVCNGSSDVIPSSHVDQVVTYLRLRCQQWTSTPHANDQAFDAAVFALLQAAIAEGARWLDTHNREHAEENETDAQHEDHQSNGLDNLNWEDQPGCGIPDQCLVIGRHQRGECYTADTVEAHDQAMRDAESWPTVTDRPF